MSPQRWSMSVGVDLGGAALSGRTPRWSGATASKPAPARAPELVAPGVGRARGSRGGGATGKPLRASGEHVEVDRRSSVTVESVRAPSPAVAAGRTRRPGRSPVDAVVLADQVTGLHRSRCSPWTAASGAWRPRGGRRRTRPDRDGADRRAIRRRCRPTGSVRVLLASPRCCRWSTRPTCWEPSGYLVYGGRRRGVHGVPRRAGRATPIACTSSRRTSWGCWTWPAWLDGGCVRACGCTAAVPARCSTRWENARARRGLRTRFRTERFLAKDHGAPVPIGAVRGRAGSHGRARHGHPGRVTVLDAVRTARVSMCCRRAGRAHAVPARPPSSEGTPDHRDSILDDDEREVGDSMFICVSRACTDRTRPRSLRTPPDRPHLCLGGRTAMTQTTERVPRAPDDGRRPLRSRRPGEPTRSSTPRCGTRARSCTWTATASTRWPATNRCTPHCGDWQAFESSAGVGLTTSARRSRGARRASSSRPTRRSTTRPRRVLSKLLGPRALRGLRDVGRPTPRSSWTRGRPRGRVRRRRGVRRSVPAAGLPGRGRHPGRGPGEPAPVRGLPVQLVRTGERPGGGGQPATPSSPHGSTHNAPATCSPRTDSAAKIWAAADSGDLTPEQAPLIVRSLLSAGVDTTVHGLRRVLYALATYPEQWRRLRGNAGWRGSRSTRRSAGSRRCRPSSAPRRRDVQVGGARHPGR